MGVHSVLRPGAMIYSEILSEEDPEGSIVQTTTGVLVENSQGREFMTTASSSKVGRPAYILHIGHYGNVVGRAVAEIPCTDMSLVEIISGAEFVNETSENNVAVTKFSRLADSNDTFEWGPCYLNSPLTGPLEGAMVAKSVKIELDDDHDSLFEDPRLVVYNWAYMGQEEDNPDSVRPHPTTRGAAVWGEAEGVVLGFHHHHIAEGKWAGFSASVSASELVEAGYRLVE